MAEKALSNPGQSSISTSSNNNVVLGVNLNSVGGNSSTMSDTVTNLTVTNLLTAEFQAILANANIENLLTYTNSVIGEGKIYFVDRSKQLVIESTNVVIKGNLNIENLVVANQTTSHTSINTDQLIVRDPIVTIGQNSNSSKNMNDRGIIFSYQDNSNEDRYGLIQFHFNKTDIGINDITNNYYAFYDRPVNPLTQIELDDTNVNNLEDYTSNINLATLKYNKAELNYIGAVNNTITFLSKVMFQGVNKTADDYISWLQNELKINTTTTFTTPSKHNYIYVDRNTGGNYAGIIFRDKQDNNQTPTTKVCIFLDNNSILHISNGTVDSILVDQPNSTITINSGNKIKFGTGNNFIKKLDNNNDTIQIGNNLDVSNDIRCGGNLYVDGLNITDLNTENLVVADSNIQFGIKNNKNILNFKGPEIIVGKNHNYIKNQYIYIYNCNLVPNINGLHIITDISNNSFTISTSITNIGYYGPIDYFNIDPSNKNRPIINLSGTYNSNERYQFAFKFNKLNNQLTYSYKYVADTLNIDTISYINTNLSFTSTINLSDFGIVINFDLSYFIYDGDTMYFYAQPNTVISGYSCNLRKFNESINNGINYTTIDEDRIRTYGLNFIPNNDDSFWYYNDHIKFTDKGILFNNSLLKGEDDNSLYFNNERIVKVNDQPSDILQTSYPIKVTDDNKIIMENIKVTNDIQSGSLNTDSIITDTLTVKNNVFEEKDDNLLYLNDNNLIELPSESLQTSYPIKVTDDNKIIMENIKINNDIQSGSLNTDSIITDTLTVKSNVFEEKDDNQLYLNNNNLIELPSESLYAVYPIKVTDDNKIIMENIKVTNDIQSINLNTENLTTNNLSIKSNVFEEKDDNLLYLNDNNLIELPSESLQTSYPIKVTDDNKIIMENLSLIHI